MRTGGTGKNFQGKGVVATPPQASEVAARLNVLQWRWLLGQGEVAEEMGLLPGGTQAARRCLGSGQERSPRTGEGIGLGSDKRTECS